jgi:hypothetical protein
LASSRRKIPKVNNRLANKDEYTDFLEDGGLYPDVEDPQFVSRLLSRSEFAETESTFNPADNPCASGPDFEITPVQRFVANFLHPRTPYNGALLYHGVGVGKTCAAIQTAEAYLDVYPRRKAFIICPEAVRSGFLRTIFDFSEENLTIGKGDEPNSARGCTGNTYLKLTECLYERDIDVIRNKIKRAIMRRYAFFGYIEFRNYIRNVVRYISGDDIAERRAMALQKEFNYRLLIIDEAHNVRATTLTQRVGLEEVVAENEASGEPAEQETEDAAKKKEKSEKMDAVKLAPFLQELLMNTEGIKLMLMTATPMFNTVFEIHFLLNLLLMNDKKPLIEIRSILNEDGTLADGAEEILKPVANAYVSFMRGENPISFPLRLYPEGLDPNGLPVLRLTPALYPARPLAGDPVSPQTKVDLSKLPILLSKSPAESYYDAILKRITSSNVAGGADANVLDNLVQASNCVFPPASGEYNEQLAETYVGNAGFRAVFRERTDVGSPGARETTVDPSWLLEENFRAHSPKGASIVRYVSHGEGVQFVYSRFIYSGALLLALALEANGLVPYNRPPLFTNGIQHPLGKLCAKCPKHRKEHRGADHEFVGAKYALLTGDPKLSTTAYIADAIAKSRSAENVNGEIIKVVIGSEVTSEGVDFKFIREIHILDAWFNFAKMEQIIGRGIRYCSHSMLPIEKRNTTIFLHAILYNNPKSRESADLYCYRKTLYKAMQVGEISRRLKVFAVDCNLRKNVTILRGVGRRIQTDSQGQTRSGPRGEVLEEEDEGVMLDDMDFSPICDWMECRPIVCEPDVTVDLRTSDDSTYSQFSAQYRASKIKQIIAQIFNTEQPWQRQEDLIQTLLMRGIPRSAVDLVLQDIINNRNFKIRARGLEGYLTYKNKYFLFQPDKYKNIQIPMALRVAQYPLKRDRYTPDPIDIVRPEGPLVVEDTVTISDEEKTTARDFWATLVGWVHDIIEGRRSSATPIERNIELYTRKTPAMKAVFMHRLEMIVYLNGKIENKELFEKIVLEYLWDEFLDTKIQVMLLFDAPTPIGKEQLLESGSIRAVRNINPSTNKLEYFCKTGETIADCNPGVVEVFESPDVEDAVRERKADVLHAGKPYGVIVPKRGAMVFKTFEPHPIGKGEKPRSGQECGIIAKRAQYIDKLVELGTILKRAGENDLDLDEAGLNAVADVINTTARGCAILDIVLRFMDAKRIGKRRWFFRPLAAYYSGHKGIVSSAAVATAAAPPPPPPKGPKPEKKKKKFTLVREPAAAEESPEPPSLAPPPPPPAPPAPPPAPPAAPVPPPAEPEPAVEEAPKPRKIKGPRAEKFEAIKKARLADAMEKAARRAIEEEEAAQKAAEDAARIEAEQKEQDEKTKRKAEKKAKKAAKEAEQQAAEAARLEVEHKEEQEKAKRKAIALAEEAARLQKARIETEKKAAEEAARLEAEQKEQEEKAKRKAEKKTKKAAEEAARLEAEKKAAEELARLEAARLEAERKAAEEAARLEAERKEQEEKAKRKAEKKAKKAAEEAAEEAEKKRKAEKKAKKAAEEAARMAAPAPLAPAPPPPAPPPPAPPPPAPAPLAPAAPPPVTAAPAKKPLARRPRGGPAVVLENTADVI